MMKSPRIVFGTLLCLLAFQGVLFAQVPVRKEEVIYALEPFAGKEYTNTFSREESDTVYLMANVYSFVGLVKGLVYFWPITGEWKLDTENVQTPFQGILEVRGRNIMTRKISLNRYAYMNFPAEKAFIGAEADAAKSQYDKAQADYQKAQSEYNQALSEGKEAQAPVAPNYFIQTVREAYPVNLPAGDYSIRFITSDGAVVEGSEKRLVVFGRSRGQGYGYDLILGDRWTRLVYSSTPSSVLYMDGTTDLFLKPFLQDEYNDFEYSKMLSNDGRGNPSLWKWVKTRQVPQASIDVKQSDGSTSTVVEEGFTVQQIEGAALGYKILPFVQGPETTAPDLTAYRIPIQRDTGVLKIGLKDGSGMPVRGGERQIRVVRPPGGGRLVLLFLLAFAPVLVMIPIMAIRRSHYSLE